ncbi:hypothetical protein ES703_45976 [subsurface metagenome]
MKISKAIEIQNDLLNHSEIAFTPDELDSINLGIEALKFTQAVRGTILNYATLPLPGETKD